MLQPLMQEWRHEQEEAGWLHRFEAGFGISYFFEIYLAIYRN